MRKIITVILALFLLSLSQAALAQNIQDQIRIEEQKRRKLEASENKVLSGESRLVFDHGGWIDYRFDQFKNDDNNDSARDSLDYTTSVDLRYWVKATLRPKVSSPHQNEHSIYVRLKNIYTVTAPEDLNDSYDNEGPTLDQGYMVLDMRPVFAEMGRRYYSVGQGIAYGNVHDGLELNANFTDWNFKGFVTRTLPHEANIDLSVPGGTKQSDRNFFGAEGRYIGLPGGHSIYAFYLLQKDHSEEKPADTARDFIFDSEYIGLGLQGKAFPRANYWLEIIRQSGTTQVFSTNETSNIDAWAVDAGLTYDMDIFTKPNFSLEYAFGSGDTDRTSVTDTSSGNTAGQDHNFLYFGYLPTGYALAPRLSNLHMIRASALLYPFEKIEKIKDITFGIDYYRFYKDKKAGGISDTQASVSDTEIGSEVDLTLNWQILSDVRLTLEYGYFWPGDAFAASTKDSEEYFSANVNLTF